MNKTGEGVTINEQNEAEKTNTIYPLRNTNVLIIVLFLREWGVVLSQMEKGIWMPKNIL